MDTVGVEDTIVEGLKMLARGGRLILVAVSRKTITIDITMLSGERLITSSANNLYHEYTIAVELMASGRIKVRPFITHVFRLEEIHEAFKIALKRKIMMR